MKEWACVQVVHHKDVGVTIVEWQKQGWRLHTYTCAGPYGTVGVQVNHYLLFEKVIRKTVGLTIRQDLYRISREYGINLSKLLESSLIQLLDTQNTRFSLSEGSIFAKENLWRARGELNP